MIALILLGCGLLRLPSPEVEGLSLTHLDAEGAGLEVALAVENPLWVDVPLERLDWELTVAGGRVAGGRRARVMILPAGATTSVPVPVEVRYADLWAAAGQAGGPEVPYRVSLELGIVTPRGSVTVPLAHEGLLPTLRPPSVDVIDLDLGWDGAWLRLDLILKLGMPRGWVIPALDWSLEVDARQLARGSLEVGEQGTLKIPVRFDPRQTAWASWSWARGEARILSLALGGQLETPLGTVPVALRQQLELSEPPPAPGGAGAGL